MHTNFWTLGPPVFVFLGAIKRQFFLGTIERTVFLGDNRKTVFLGDNRKRVLCSGAGVSVSPGGGPGGWRLGGALFEARRGLAADSDL